MTTDKQLAAPFAARDNRSSRASNGWDRGEFRSGSSYPLHKLAGLALVLAGNTATLCVVARCALTLCVVAVVMGPLWVVAREASALSTQIGMEAQHGE